MTRTLAQNMQINQIKLKLNTEFIHLILYLYIYARPHPRTIYNFKHLKKKTHKLVVSGLFGAEINTEGNH